MCVLEAIYVGPHFLLANTQGESPPAPLSAERNATAVDGSWAGTDNHAQLEKPKITNCLGYSLRYESKICHEGFCHMKETSLEFS